MKLLNPLEHPIIFTPPLRNAPSAWIAHVPFGMLLIDLLRPKTIVELGTFYGVSYCAFCQAVRELDFYANAYAIDTWRGDKHGGFFGDEVLEDLRTHHDPLYGSFSRLVQSTFDDAVSHFPDGSLDLLHIDGLHTYESVKHDFETWLPKMSKSGVVLFHDINVREADFGVWKLWEELSAKHPSFAMAHGHGLGVLAIGYEVPTTINFLFEMSHDETVAFREFFHRLGKELELKSEHDQHIQNLMAQIREQAINEQALTAKVSEQDDAIQVLTSKLAEQGERAQILIAQINERDERIQAVNTQLNEIYISKAWKVALALRNIRVFLLPPDGLIVKTFGGFKKSISILKNEGLKILFNRAKNKIIPDQHVLSSVTTDTNFIEPIVSIIIPVYNAQHLTSGCLEKIYSVETALPYEVIVIDNNSSDNTPKILRGFKKQKPNFKYFRMESNLGFAGAINYGALKARGNIIIILNNDTLVAPHWLDRLIQPFNDNSDIGIVSPVTNYVGEGPQIDPEAINIKPEQIDNYGEQIQNRPWIFEPNRLVFFCVAIKREVFDLIGYLDVGYEKGNFEDDDFCLRAILAGFRLAIAKNSFVYHFGSATFKENLISHSGFMEKNRKRFFRKAQNISITKRPPRLISENPIVSIIVRTKNRPHLLRKALLSLSNQTNNQFETIIINDGGEDISKIVQEFSIYYPITYVRNENSVGRTEALNIGVNHCQGEWIGILDDDDIVYPWHLDNLLTAVSNNPAEKFFYTNYNQSLFDSSINDYSIKLVGVEPWEFDAKELLVNNHVPIHSWLISRSCFLEVGNFDEKLSMLEDYEFLIRLSKEYNFCHINRVTCEYRFYLDGVNSIVNNRLKTKEALLSIYEAHQSDDPMINERRKKSLILFDNQLNAINKIQSSTYPDEPSELSISYRKIMNIVTGL